MTVAIIIFIVISVLTVICCVMDTSAIKDAKRGIFYDCIFTGNYYSNVSRKRLDEWLRAHPQSEKIYKAIRSGNFTEDNMKETGDRLIEMGAKLVVLNICGEYNYFVITDEMVAAGKGCRNEIFTSQNKKLVLQHIKVDFAPVTTTIDAPAAQKSVVKSAVAGGVLAGGVGAVIGAATAINHNNRVSGKTEHISISHGTRDDGVYYHYYIAPENQSYRFCLENKYNQEIDKQYGIYAAAGIDIENKRINSLISNILDAYWK